MSEQSDFDYYMNMRSAGVTAHEGLARIITLHMSKRQGISSWQDLRRDVTNAVHENFPPSTVSVLVFDDDGTLASFIIGEIERALNPALGGGKA